MIDDDDITLIGSRLFFYSANFCIFFSRDMEDWASCISMVMRGFSIFPVDGWLCFFVVLIFASQFV